jgi:PKD repeat protein
LWDFGGTFSTLQNPVHSWNLPGVYQVTLTVTNACNCTGTCMVEIIVDPLIGVNIECPSPVCPNETVMYYTDAAGCASFDWTVINGTILSSGPPYGFSIQVQWNDGSNGPGILCLDGSNCSHYCPEVTCITIPIVSATSSISGPAIVCTGSQTSYSVPEMPGTIFTWTLTPITAGSILGGNGTNEIFVQWQAAPGTATIEVDYFNEFLDCGGEGSLPVEIRDEFTISGPEDACPGTIIDFVAGNPLAQILNWTATDENNITYSLGNHAGTPFPFSVTWTYGSGTFVITATRLQA